MPMIIPISLTNIISLYSIFIFKNLLEQFKSVESANSAKGYHALHWT